LEALVMQGLRSHLTGTSTQHGSECDDRSLIEEYISRAIVHADAIEIVFKARPDETESASDQDAGLMEEGAAAVQSIKLPWMKKCAVAKKGISYELPGAAVMKPEAQQAILGAIAKARIWMDDLVSGRVSSIKKIARHEKITERYLRQLMSLAFASPQFVCAIARGEGSEHLTLTELAAAFPASWPAQSQLLQS
jgi:site-specific DNA recombinase